MLPSSEVCLIFFLWKWKWSRSVVSSSLQPHGLQPTRLLNPWNLPGRSTRVGCHCLLQCIFSLLIYKFHVKFYLSQSDACCCCWVTSVVSDSVRPHRQQPTRLPSLGFSRREYWSGLPFPSLVHESEKWKFSHSVVSDWATPWTVAF